MPMPCPLEAAVLWNEKRHEIIVLDRIPLPYGPDEHGNRTVRDYSRECGYHNAAVIWHGVRYAMVKQMDLDGGFFPPHAIEDPERQARQAQRRAENLATWETMWPPIVARYIAAGLAAPPVRRYDWDWQESIVELA